MEPSSVSPLIAAVASVAHRRTGQQEVVVRYLGSPDGPRHVRLGMAPATTFGQHVEAAATALAGRAAAGPAEAADCVVELSLDARTPSPDGGPMPRIDVCSDEAGGFVCTGTGPDGADWARQTAAALASGGADPETPIRILNLLSAHDRALIESFSGTGLVEPAAAGIPALFDAHAARHPEAVAVVCEGRTLSYGELAERSDQVARALVRARTGRYGVVGVLCPPSTDLVVVLLGILKAGCCYLGLAPEDPPARWAQVLRLAEAEVVVTQGGLGDRLAAESAVEVLDLDTLSAADTEGQVLPETNPDHLAYVSFTSGSTGEPKGVAVPHRGVLRLLCDANWIDIRAEDRFIHLSPIAFDASTIEIWGPLLNGASLTVYPRRPVDLAELAQTVAGDQVSVLLLATGLFHQMVGDHLEAFKGVRHVLTGGDVAAPNKVERLLAAYPEVLFTNGYGPTENTSYTTCWTSSAAAVGRSVPIGPPIRGTRIAVLDDTLQPVPPGVCGELYASGSGLAHGYLGKAAATAERFVADPAAERPGARMYRTGDLVRWLPDGDIEFISRVDRQIKVRGYRVEPGHIEEELLRSGLLTHAVVVAQYDAGSGNRLLAYVVLRPGASTEPAELEAELRSHLAERLPRHMIPWAILVRQELPVNRNGKVDRSALPVEGRIPRSLPGPYVAPRTTMERRMTEIWGGLLRVEPVGVEDSFFELGGYSLLAAELLATVRRELDVEISAISLYAHPTIAGLAALEEGTK